MEFRTKVDIPQMSFTIEPHEEMLFVGSCFAAEVGRRFQEEQFRAVVNPFGTMYNPASVLHTLVRMENVCARIVFLTLGTNHVYVEKSTGEIVDNCQKRPAALFEERELTVSECADYLRQAVELLCGRREDVHIVFTVSPIRYRKYGYHESQLSKATLLLAAEQVIDHYRSLAATAVADATRSTPNASLNYFPSYEIVMDELRDYRFYKPDMLHPSEQAVDYVWERLVCSCFSERARQWLDDWRPVKQALAHRPLNADSDDYRDFMDKTMLKVEELRKKYPTFASILLNQQMQTR